MRGSGGRLVTWIVVLAVAALAGAATLDAVRADAPRAEDARAGSARAPLRGAAAELAEAGVEGSLSYVDVECRAHTLRLPATTSVDVPPTVPCRIAPPLRPPPAFFERPRGTIAAVRRAAAPVVDAASPGRVDVRRLAWLDDSRVAAIVAQGAGGAARTAIVVVERGSLVGSMLWLPSRAARIFVSPLGSFFAVATKGPSHFFLLDRDARTGALADVARDWFGRTSLTGARAITWSPDERWTALAKNESVYVFTTDDRAPNPKLVRLPIEARDLAWD